MDGLTQITEQVGDGLAVALVLVAGLMSLAAGIGLMRFPDTLTRLHAGAKPQVLGVIAICTAIVLRMPSFPILALASLVVLFQMFTQPIAAHMVGRATYRSESFDKSTLILDELAEEIDEAPARRKAGKPNLKPGKD